MKTRQDLGDVAQLTVVGYPLVFSDPEHDRVYGPPQCWGGIHRTPFLEAVRKEIDISGEVTKGKWELKLCLVATETTPFYLAH